MQNAFLASFTTTSYCDIMDMASYRLRHQPARGEIVSNVNPQCRELKENMTIGVNERAG